MVATSYFEILKTVVPTLMHVFLASAVYCIYIWSVLLKGGSSVCTSEKVRRIPVPANR